MQKEVSIPAIPFIVRESPIINYLFGTIFLLMSVYGLITITTNYQNIKSYEYIACVMFLPALFFLKKAQRKKIVLQLDESGLYFRGKLITTWQNFVSGYITALEQPGSLMDSFVLVLEYYTPEKGIVYRINLNMDDSQDKSDNEIMDAIKYFSDKVIR